MSRQAAVLTRERESSAWLAWVQRQAATVAVGAVTFWLAYDGGTFGLTTRNSVAIAVWWTVLVAVALGLWSLTVVPRAAAAAGVLLAACAAFTLASTLWASSNENAFDEFDRTLLYVGVLLVAVIAWRRGDAARVADGLALGIVATAGVALGSRCYPHVFGTDTALRFLPAAAHRLSYPVDYWNGLAILVALAFPLLLRGATFAEHPLARALAVAPMPAVAGTIYLTSSRGGFATALVGALVFVLLTPRRIASLGVLAVAGAGSAAVIAVLHARPELVNMPGTSAALSQGRPAGLLIVAICAFAAAARLVLDLAAQRAPAPGPRVEAVAALGLVAILVAGIALSHPVRRFDTFKRPPPDLTQPIPLGPNPTQSHLLSGSGTGRWQQWAAAIDEWRSRPLIGRGSGSFESWWAQHGSLTGFISDAHSLYAETLGELGIVGFVLLVGALALGLVSGAVRVRRVQGAERAAVAAVAAAYVGYLLGAGIDWMWEMTIVSIVGVTLLGLLTGPATLPVRASDDRPAPRLARRLATVAVILVGACALYTEAVPVLAALRLRASQHAIERGDAGAALKRALDARYVEPWASSPYLQLALVQEQTGDLSGARASIRSAIKRDDDNWRLWLVRARLATKQGALVDATRSLRHAAALNPRSPLFAALRRQS